MKPLPLVLFASLVAAPALAEDARQLGAHEHGVGQLNIAFDGLQIAMELRAPGADIVGFEYAATSADDLAAIDTAVATLARPLELFALPPDAGCSVVQATAELEGSDAIPDDHAEDEHAHDEHAEDQHSDDEHAGHDDDDAASSAGHAEFHAQYLLTCADTAAVTNMAFNYFTTFGNAQELEVQVISDTAARAFEVLRASPTLDLRDLF